MYRHIPYDHDAIERIEGRPVGQRVAASTKRLSQDSGDLCDEVAAAGSGYILPSRPWAGFIDN